jgi:hypothetical protein
MNVGRIVDLPDVRDVQSLVTLLNERLRVIEENLRRPAALTADLDAQGHRITNLGEPRAGSDAATVFAVERRVAAVSKVETRVPAAVSTTVQRVTQAAAGGGGADTLILSVPGVVSIRSDATPLVTLGEERTATEVVLLVKEPPLGGDLTVVIDVGGDQWAEATIPDGEDSVTVPVEDSIAAEALVQVHITEVGLTFPGADLTVLVRLA